MSWFCSNALVKILGGANLGVFSRQLSRVKDGRPTAILRLTLRRARSALGVHLEAPCRNRVYIGYAGVTRGSTRARRCSITIPRCSAALASVKLGAQPQQSINTTLTTHHSPHKHPHLPPLHLHVKSDHHGGQHGRRRRRGRAAQNRERRAEGDCW